MTISAEQAAVVNAFLFRCGGIQDLALTYLKEALKLACQAAGAPLLANPPRGQGERFLDWLDAAQMAGVETPAIKGLREALEAVPKDPTPLPDVSEIKPVVAGESRWETVRRISTVAFGFEDSGPPDRIAAAYWTALLVDRNDELANLNLAIHYQTFDRTALATAQYELLLKNDPSFRPALIGLHNLALHKNQMATLAPHLQNYIQLSEREGQAEPGDDRAPVISLTPTNGVTVGKLVLNRGTAHVQGAIRLDACAVLRRSAEHWFKSNPTRLSLPLIEMAPQYQDLSLVLEPPMLDVLITIFGRKPEVSITDTYLRKVTPNAASSYIPFHQDATALANAGLNIWIPMIDCGVDAPGLEIMARRTASILPTITSSGDYNQMEIDPALVFESFPEEVRFYPTPKVGDAVLFLGSTVHRSHIAAGMTKERASLELRLY